MSIIYQSFRMCISIFRFRNHVLRYVVCHLSFSSKYLRNYSEIKYPKRDRKKKLNYEMFVKITSYVKTYN